MLDEINPKKQQTDPVAGDIATIATTTTDTKPDNKLAESTTDHQIQIHGTTNTTKTTTSTPNYSDNNSKMPLPPLPLPPTLKFGPFPLSTTPGLTPIFHLSQTRLTYGLVNIKPLLPGHILICPVRRVPRLHDLTIPETTDLFSTVRRVQRTLKRVYKAHAFNVAIQDGVEAGQSVPHVHVHVIPRRDGDMDERGGGDQLYEMMDGEEGDIGGVYLDGVDGGGGSGGRNSDDGVTKNSAGEDETKEEKEIEKMRKWRDLRNKESKQREFQPDEARVKRSEVEMGREAEMLYREMLVDLEKDGDDY